MRKPRPGEISPYNARAVAGPHGIWNEESLPVTEWEAPQQRVVVPWHLQASMRLDTPVLRWSLEKFIAISTGRPWDMPAISELTRYLDCWQFHGEETGLHAGNLRILFPDETNRWYAVSIGPDRSGSYNMITIVGSRRRSHLANRLRELRNVVEKG